MTQHDGLQLHTTLERQIFLKRPWKLGLGRQSSHQIPVTILWVCATSDFCVFFFLLSSCQKLLQSLFAFPYPTLIKMYLIILWGLSEHSSLHLRTFATLRGGRFMGCFNSSVAEVLVGYLHPGFAHSCLQLRKW